MRTPRAPRVKKERAARKHELLSSIAPPEGRNRYTIEQMNLLEQWEAKKVFIATNAHDVVKRSCQWCLETYPYKNGADLPFGNRFDRNAYDSEECQKNDAIMRGWKTIDKADDEDEITL